MDALSRRRLSQHTTTYNTYHNPNWTPSRDLRAHDKPKPKPPSPRAVSSWLCELPAHHAGPHVPFAKWKPPAPTAYAPRLTADGHEHQMADLNGAELMPSASFSGQTPARASPVDWRVLVDGNCLVATRDDVGRREKAPWRLPKSPGPQTYAARHASRFYGPPAVRAQIPKTGREVFIPGTLSESGKLGPGIYETGHDTVDARAGETAFARRAAHLFNARLALKTRTDTERWSGLRPHTVSPSARAAATQRRAHRLASSSSAASTASLTMSLTSASGGGGGGAAWGFSELPGERWPYETVAAYELLARCSTAPARL